MSWGTWTSIAAIGAYAALIRWKRWPPWLIAAPAVVLIAASGAARAIGADESGILSYVAFYFVVASIVVGVLADRATTIAQ